MKKINILILLIITLTLTGCSNTVKCEIKTSNYTSSIKIKFKNEQPTTYNFKDKMNFSTQDANAELYYHGKYNEYNTLISEKYAKLTNDSTGVSTKIKYDFTKDKSTSEKKLLIKKNDTQKSAIKKIESLGYKCK